MMVSAPFLLAGLAVGLIVSIIQAATSIQEQTLSFIPKVVVTGIVIAIGGPWMMDQLSATRSSCSQASPHSSGRELHTARWAVAARDRRHRGRRVRARDGTGCAALPARSRVLGDATGSTREIPRGGGDLRRADPDCLSGTDDPDGSRGLCSRSHQRGGSRPRVRARSWRSRRGGDRGRVPPRHARRLLVRSPGRPDEPATRMRSSVRSTRSSQ